MEEVAEPAPRGGKGLMYALAAVLAIVAVGVGFLIIRGSNSGPPPPTAEELASQRAAQEERIRALAARMVEETMKEKEAEIMAELEERQQNIESLQKKLEESQKRSSSEADRARQQELQRQIEAEREQQRVRQAALEEEKQRLLEEAKTEAEEQAKKEAELAAEAETEEAVEPAPAPTEVAAAIDSPADRGCAISRRRRRGHRKPVHRSHRGRCAAGNHQGGAGHLVESGDAVPA